MATADHRSAAQGNPLAGLIRSGRFEVSVVRKVSKREIATPNSKVHTQKTKNGGLELIVQMGWEHRPS